MSVWSGTCGVVWLGERVCLVVRERIQKTRLYGVDFRKEPGYPFYRGVRESKRTQIVVDRLLLAEPHVFGQHLASVSGLR